ncbi:MAG TPA: molecular chaperone, partial [Candidatus Ventrousia excrementavium]|nr:molecular chaperone [Candidatus Ventrousia excrementavium]
SYVRELLNMSDRSELSVSKYYLARSVALHV